jgi:D-glycero-D-manno-heptose 1,7-bisphosphate phosphatase
VRRADHVRSWAEFEFLPGSLEAMRRLRSAGERVLVLTNQAAVGRGQMSPGELDEIHDRMRAEVEAAGGLIDGVLACVHRPDEGCRCRKPAPGLFYRAAGEMRVDLRRSVMIGDAWSDVQAAHAAGCRAVWVGPDAEVGSVPVARDLLDAVTLLREC